MPTCILPPGTCIATPNCTTKCQLSVLDAKKPLKIDCTKVRKTIETHDIKPKE